MEVAAGLLGTGALTFGIVYYLKSRRDLEESMVHVGPLLLTTTHLWVM